MKNSWHRVCGTQDPNGVSARQRELLFSTTLGAFQSLLTPAQPGRRPAVCLHSFREVKGWETWTFHVLLHTFQPRTGNTESTQLSPRETPAPAPNGQRAFAADNMPSCLEAKPQGLGRAHHHVPLLQPCSSPPRQAVVGPPAVSEVLAFLETST